MTGAAARSLAALGLAITLAGAAFGNPAPPGRSAPPGYETARSVLTTEGREVAELVRAGAHLTALAVLNRRS